MHDPIVLSALSYLPEPNRPGSQCTNRENFFAQGIDSRTTTKNDIKADHLVNDKSRMMARYSRPMYKGNPDNRFGEGNPAHTFDNRGPTDNSVHQGVFEWNRTQSPTTMINILSRGAAVTSSGWTVRNFASFQCGMPLNLTQRGGDIWDASQRPQLIGNSDPGGSVYDKLTS